MKQRGNANLLFSDLSTRCIYYVYHIYIFIYMSCIYVYRMTILLGVISVYVKIVLVKTFTVLFTTSDFQFFYCYLFLCCQSDVFVLLYKISNVFKSP